MLIWPGTSAVRLPMTNHGPFEWNIAPALDVEYENLRTDLRPLPKRFGLRARTIFSVAGSSTADTIPITKLRLFPRGSARFDENRAVHEDAHTNRRTAVVKVGALIHHSYPTLSDYIDHMNRYSSLAAEMIVAKGKVRFSVINIVVRPLASIRL